MTQRYWYEQSPCLPIIDMEAEDGGWDEAPIVILCEDPIIHSDSHLFCSDPLCPCHDDRQAVRHAIIEPLDQGLLTWEEGSRIFFDRQV